MNTLILVCVCIIILFQLFNFLYTYGVHFEFQSNGVYIMWYRWVHNAYGEYYKLTYRKCIWKIQPEE